MTTSCNNSVLPPGLNLPPGFITLKECQQSDGGPLVRGGQRQSNSPIPTTQIFQTNDRDKIQSFFCLHSTTHGNQNCNTQEITHHHASTCLSALGPLALILK